MARLVQTGFEIGGWPSASLAPAPDGWSSTPGVLETTIKRTGDSSLKITASGQQANLLYTPVASGKVWVRFYFYKTSNPGSAARLASFPNAPSIHLSTAGEIYVVNLLGAQVGSASAALADSTWHRIEVEADYSGSDIKASLRVNGTDYVTAAQVNSGGVDPTQFSVNANTTFTFYVDDVALNDSSGSVNNTWVGEGAVVLLKPSADVQDGSWTVASGGNTNLFDAVNNTPPTGSAASDAARIENIDGSADNATDECRFSTATYTAAGIASGSTINAIIPWVCAGEEVSTGTKEISFGLLSNPAGSLNAVVDVTNGVTGAVGTYPATWYWQKGAAIEAPSVTLGTAPQLNLRKVDTGTRSVTVCFLGAYVDYAPPSGPTARSGSGAATLPALTSSGTGTKGRAGSGAAALPALTGAGTGSKGRAGSGSTTLPALTAAGTGSQAGPTRTGSGAATLPALTASGTGSKGRAGSGSATLPTLTAAGTGSKGRAGTGSASLPALTASGTGKKARSGTGAATLPTLAASGAGKKGRASTGSATLPSLTAAGTGTKAGPTRTGSGSATLPTLAASGAGKKGRAGTGAAVLPTLTGAGTGTKARAGSGAATLPALTASGIGSSGLAVNRLGSGAATLPTLTAAGAGQKARAGTGAATLPALTADGAGTKSRAGSGAATLPALAASGSGSSSFAVNWSGFGAATLGALTADGAGSKGRAGSGGATLAALTGAGIGTKGHTGAGGATLPILLASGGLVGHVGSGAAVLPLMTAAGQGYDPYIVPPSGGGRRWFSSLSGPFMS